MDEEQGDALCTTLNNGPWAEDAKETMVTLVKRCMATKAPCKRRGLQTCLGFAQYQTQPEWDSINSDALMIVKIGQVTHRAYSIGITCQSCPTVRIIINMLVVCHFINKKLPEEWPDEEHMEQLMKTLKANIKSQSAASGKYALGHMVKYPMNPKDLPADMYEYAYPVDIYGPPVPCDDAKFMCFKGPKCRQRNKGSNADLAKIMSSLSKIEKQGSGNLAVENENEKEKEKNASPDVNMPSTSAGMFGSALVFQPRLPMQNEDIPGGDEDVSFFDKVNQPALSIEDM